MKVLVTASFLATKKHCFNVYENTSITAWNNIFSLKNNFFLGIWIRSNSHDRSAVLLVAFPSPPCSNHCNNSLGRWTFCWQNREEKACPFPKCMWDPFPVQCDRINQDGEMTAMENWSTWHTYQERRKSKQTNWYATETVCEEEKRKGEQKRGGRTECWPLEFDDVELFCYEY